MNPTVMSLYVLVPAAAALGAELAALLGAALPPLDEQAASIVAMTTVATAKDRIVLVRVTVSPPVSWTSG